MRDTTRARRARQAMKTSNSNALPDMQQKTSQRRFSGTPTVVPASTPGLTIRAGNFADRARLFSSHGQQARIAADRGRVDGHRLFSGEAVQVIGTAGFGSGA